MYILKIIPDWGGKCYHKCKELRVCSSEPVQKQQGMVTSPGDPSMEVAETSPPSSISSA